LHEIHENNKTTIRYWEKHELICHVGGIKLYITINDDDIVAITPFSNMSCGTDRILLFIYESLIYYIKYRKSGIFDAIYLIDKFINEEKLRKWEVKQALRKRKLKRKENV